MLRRLLLIVTVLGTMTFAIPDTADARPGRYLRAPARAWRGNVSRPARNWVQFGLRQARFWSR